MQETKEARKLKLLYGTGNPAKLEAMRRRLESLDIIVIGLKELNTAIPEVPENGNSPLENARAKAAAYYKAFHMPVFPAIRDCILRIYRKRSSRACM